MSNLVSYYECINCSSAFAVHFSFYEEYYYPAIIVCPYCDHTRFELDYESYTRRSDFHAKGIG